MFPPAYYVMTEINLVSETKRFSRRTVQSTKFDTAIEALLFQPSATKIDESIP